MIVQIVRAMLLQHVHSRTLSVKIADIEDIRLTNRPEMTILWCHRLCFRKHRVKISILTEHTFVFVYNQLHYPVIHVIFGL